MRLRRLLNPVKIVAALAIAAGPLAAVAVPAAASTTFSNTTSIGLVNPTSSSAQAASLYPSPITVSGQSGTISDLTVILSGIDYSYSEDLCVLLVAPNGKTLILMSAVGSNDQDNSGTDPTSGLDATFSDSGTEYAYNTALPTSGSVTMAPRDDSGSFPGYSYDQFPSPAPGSPYGEPAAVGSETLAQAFDGISPNGTWDLYVTTNSEGDGSGSISGGWSLNITTASTDLATTTSVSSSLNPSFTATPDNGVTFTATVSSSDGTPTGTVAFTANGNPITACGADALTGGQAQCSTSFTTEGSYVVAATYSGTTSGNPTYIGSEGFVTQQVDTHTVVSGNTFTNPGGITIPPGSGTPTTADQYPSRIFVSGLTGVISSLSVKLSGVNFETYAQDLQVLLVGPSGASLVLMSDVGPNSAGSPAINDANFIFEDSASTLMTQSAGPVSGTYKPTDYLNFDQYPAPAPSSYNSPATAGSSTLSGEFAGLSPNGTWELFVIEDGGSNDLGGSIGSWALSFTLPQQVQFTSTAPNPALVGTTYDAMATGSPSGVAVQYSIDPSSTPGACSVNASTGVVSFLGAGTCVVDASQAATTGWAASNVAQQPIPVVSPPVIANVETTPLSYQSGSPPVAITGTLTVSDADDSTIASATVAITSGFASGKDTLSFINQNGITGSYNASTGVLSLSGDATVAIYQAALRSVEFSTSDASASPASRTVSFTVTDTLGEASNTASRTIDVSAAAQPPIVANVETTPLSYQSGSPPVAITGTLTVSDADDSTIASATVAITSGFASGKETLSFINQNGITGSYNASTGVLSLSGDATVADYQAALRSVEFSSTSGAGTRTISFTVTDSLGATSNTATRTIDIVAAATPGSLIVDQFRLGGPGGPGDSYADLYNASGSPLDVDGWSLGYDLAGGTLATAPLPDDTIPAGGSLLMAGPEYSLSSVASPDGTFGSGQTLDLSGGFEVLGPGSTTVDSVGFTGSGLSEGTALTVPANTSTQYAFVRNRSTGVPADTGNNAADFISVSVGGPSALAGSTLGAPAPSDLASPTPTGYAATSSLLNPSVAQTASPNRVIVSSPPTLEVRRTITNQGTTTLTNLELRIVAITTEGSPGGSAQLLAENSPSTTVTVDSHSVTVEGLTLAAPSLAGAGGLDATLSVPLQGGELAPGQSVSVQLYFAVPVGGSYSFTYQILANQI